MTTVGTPNTQYSNNPLEGYDDTNHQVTVIRVKNVTTDTSVTPNITVGDLGVDVEVTTGPPTDIVQTGTITANGQTVVATFGQGASSWTVDIDGTIGNGTVLQFEYLVNTSWRSAFGVVVGSTSDVAVSSVTLASAGTSYQGNAAGFQQFRVRCSTFNNGDSINIKIVGSVATDGGFVSKSLPPGSNLIGQVKVVDSAGSNLLAVDSSGRLSILSITNALPAGSNLIGTIELADSGGTNKLAIDSSGRLTLIPNSSMNVAQLNGVTTQMGGSDGVTASNVLEIANGLYNGATVDQQRGNLDNITILASAARTTTAQGTSSDFTNYNGRGVIVVVSVTAGSTPSLTPEIDAKDPVSGAYYSLLTASAAIAATGTFVYMVYPGASTTVTNTGVTQSSGMVLPRTWRVKVTAGNSNSITYSVSASIIV